MAYSGLQVDVIYDEEMRRKLHASQYQSQAAAGDQLLNAMTIFDVWKQPGPPQGHLHVIVTRPDVVSSLAKSREWFLSSLLFERLGHDFRLTFQPHLMLWNCIMRPQSCTISCGDRTSEANYRMLTNARASSPCTPP